MNLTLDDRTKIFDKVCRLVATKHVDPGMNGVDWDSLAREHRDHILACTDPEAFEKKIHKLLGELKTSHTGFRHAGMRNIPARHGINATLQHIGQNGSERWMFQDVHQGGPAFAAGIRPGDVLLECGGREVRPPNDLTFSVGESATLLIEKLQGDVQKVNVQLPIPKSQKHPVTAPQAVTTERLSDEIGLLRVAMFPGAIGIDVAKDIDRGVAALDGCSRLIVDLRGNTGGGIGGLRLMSYLTPGKLEVGYSLTRKRRESGYRREELTRFGAERSRKILDAFRESVDPLALEITAIEDRIAIELNVATTGRQHFKDASDLSRGQKCTALLPILLARRDNPLVIDQPEDNLDNHFIFETVVNAVQRMKKRRQMIFITHNANIPVLAEADLVLVMTSDGRVGAIEKRGTVDECREQIIELLEGGREAFQLRSKRYAATG